MRIGHWIGYGLALAAAACTHAAAPIHSTDTQSSASGLSHSESAAAPATTKPPPVSQAPGLALTFSRPGVFDIALSAPAWDAAHTQGRVVLLDSDFKSISIFDTLSGRLQFRTGLPQSSGGRHTFRLDGEKLFLWAGDRLHRIDPLTGRIVTTQSVRWNNDCHFDKEGDVCAFACSCGVQLADCETGAFIGSEFQKTHVSFHESGIDDEPLTMDSGCFGRGVGLLAAGGGVAVLSIEDTSKSYHGAFSRPLVYIGADAKTGRERWRNGEVPARSMGRTSGASRDGRFCFVGHDDASLFVMNCQTGALLWKQESKGERGDAHRKALIYAAPNGGLFQGLDTQATLFDMRTGKPRWRITLPSNTTAIPAGMPVPPYSISNDHSTQPRSLWVLDTENGAVLSRNELPPHGTAHADPSGGFYIYAVNGALSAHNEDGKLRARLKDIHPENISPGDGFVAFYGSERIVFLDRKNLQMLAELRGDFALQPHSSLDTGILLLRFAEEGQKIGEAVLLRIPKPQR